MLNVLTCAILLRGLSHAPSEGAKVTEVPLLFSLHLEFPSTKMNSATSCKQLDNVKRKENILNYDCSFLSTS